MLKILFAAQYTLKKLVVIVSMIRLIVVVGKNQQLRFTTRQAKYIHFIDDNKRDKW